MIRIKQHLAIYARVLHGAQVARNVLRKKRFLPILIKNTPTPHSLGRVFLPNFSFKLMFNTSSFILHKKLSDSHSLRSLRQTGFFFFSTSQLDELWNIFHTFPTLCTAEVFLSHIIPLSTHWDFLGIPRKIEFCQIVWPPPCSGK